MTMHHSLSVYGKYDITSPFSEEALGTRELATYCTYLYTSQFVLLASLARKEGVPVNFLKIQQKLIRLFTLVFI